MFRIVSLNRRCDQELFVYRNSVGMFPKVHSSFCEIGVEGRGNVSSGSRPSNIRRNEEGGEKS